MKCTIIIHWKIQVVIFDFFIRVIIAIKKCLLHRKTSIKQIITTTLNRSKKKKKDFFFLNQHCHIIQFTVKCIVEQSRNF